MTRMALPVFVFLPEARRLSPRLFVRRSESSLEVDVPISRSSRQGVPTTSTVSSVTAGQRSEVWPRIQSSILTEEVITSTLVSHLLVLMMHPLVVSVVLLEPDVLDVFGVSRRQHRARIKLANDIWLSITCTIALKKKKKKKARVVAVAPRVLFLPQTVPAQTVPAGYAGPDMPRKESMLVKHANTFSAIHAALLLLGEIPVFGEFFTPLKMLSEFVAKKAEAADRDATQLELAWNKLLHLLDQCAWRIEDLASDHEKKNDSLIIFLSKELRPKFFALADNWNNNKVSTASATKSLEEFISALQDSITVDTNAWARKNHKLLDRLAKANEKCK